MPIVKFSRVDPGATVVLQGDVYNKILDTLEAAAKLRVTSPLYIDDTPNGKIISFRAVEEAGFIVVKITANGGTGDPASTGGYKYSWTEQKWDGTSWVDNTDGASGDAGDDTYLANILETTTTNSDPIKTSTLCLAWSELNPDTGDQDYFVQCPHGYDGNIERYGSVHWDSSANKFTQDIHLEYFENGLMAYREDPVRLVDITPTTPCPGGSG
jgi:hypothetical protein